MAEYDYMEYDEHKAGVYLWQILPPFMILTGTIGSLISVVILNNKKNRKIAISLYLTVLSCADILSLNTGLMRHWIFYTFDIDIRELSDVVCRGHLWLLYTSLDVSAWMLVAITIERVNCVYWRARHKTTCTRLTAKRFILMVVFCLSIVNGHLLVFNGDFDEEIETENGTTVLLHHRCQYLTDEYAHFFDHYFVWIDLAVYSVLPTIVLLTGNSAILYRFIRTKMKVYNSSVAPQQMSQANRQKHLKKITSMTTILISLNTVFLVTTIPVSIYIIGYNTWYNNGDDYDLAVLSLMWPVTSIVMYTNNTINFALYVLTSKDFRSQTRALFCRTTNQTSAIQQRYNEDRAGRRQDVEGEPEHCVSHL